MTNGLVLEQTCCLRCKACKKPRKHLKMYVYNSKTSARKRHLYHHLFTNLSAKNNQQEFLKSRQWKEQLKFASINNQLKILCSTHRTAILMGFQPWKEAAYKTSNFCIISLDICGKNPACTLCVYRSNWVKDSYPHNILGLKSVALKALCLRGAIRRIHNNHRHLTHDSTFCFLAYPPELSFSTNCL